MGNICDFIHMLKNYIAMILCLNMNSTFNNNYFSEEIIEIVVLDVYFIAVQKKIYTQH